MEQQVKDFSEKVVKPGIYEIVKKWQNQRIQFVRKINDKVMQYDKEQIRHENLTQAYENAITETNQLREKIKRSEIEISKTQQEMQQMRNENAEIEVTTKRILNNCGEISDQILRANKQKETLEKRQNKELKRMQAKYQTKVIEMKKEIQARLTRLPENSINEKYDPHFESVCKLWLIFFSLFCFYFTLFVFNFLFDCLFLFQLLILLNGNISILWVLLNFIVIFVLFCCFAPFAIIFSICFTFAFCDSKH